MKSKPETGDLRERALRLLARREHSRAELVRKLGHAGFAVEDIAPLLDEFEKKNWLSDQRFAESYIADHRARSGNLKLAYELRQRGLSEAMIAAVLSENIESELDRAHEIWKKKFKVEPANESEKSKQIRFMQSRGFSVDVIRQILRNTD